MPSKLVNTLLAFYGTQISLVPPQEPTNLPYPEPVEFSSHPLILCLKGLSYCPCICAHILQVGCIL
jgi:hypothetical protein